MHKKALITGITGQDGAYLAQLLLEKQYIVYGAYRRSSKTNFWRIQTLGINQHPRLHLVEFDITDMSSILWLLKQIQPDEVYNLAAQSLVSSSFSQPIASTNVNALGPLNFLESKRIVNPNIRFYQASTSEMFGNTPIQPQSETTPFNPCSPYGAAKLYAHVLTDSYRKGYNLFACSGILFNHESPLRGHEFVTRKITSSLAKIRSGKLDYFELGNIDSKRDWGYAKEYVRGIWLMLQTDEPQDFVLAKNRAESVRYFIQIAAEAAEIPLKFENSGVNEIAINEKTQQVILKINPEFYRPADVNYLIGNPEKARKLLGWKSEISLEHLCQMMVENDIYINSEL
ncbi:GDP-mannose 4,6-dehydratase [Legionella waltersii]|uniref:GDP-mannose 4,6-dehydratase n=1 Tax=Legionella waltersii TaxID=66969 RepID=A0A0W1AN57_9GAMM|nr:GDP-mannose 4,6-dehydratase [Legionella waltersii]KTD82777.1 GDP-mannose 4,6-dehydratase [Legionella waltersii]SNV01262.1 GDP-D-mannose dehydratase, NAD(P)-binding [Legionella waltersii]